MQHCKCLILVDPAELSLLLTLILGWSDAAVFTSACPEDDFILTAGILTHLHSSGSHDGYKAVGNYNIGFGLVRVGLGL